MKEPEERKPKKKPGWITSLHPLVEWRIMDEFGLPPNVSNECLCYEIGSSTHQAVLIFLMTTTLDTIGYRRTWLKRNPPPDLDPTLSHPSLNTDLDFTLLFLRRMGFLGTYRSNRLSQILRSKSKVDVFEPDQEIDVREFLEAYLTFESDTSDPLTYPRFMQRLLLGLQWLNINRCSQSKASKKPLEEDDFVMECVFLVTSMLPVEELSLRLFIMNSEVAQGFDR